MKQRMLVISFAIVFVLISGIIYVSSGAKNVYSYQVKQKSENINVSGSTENTNSENIENLEGRTEILLTETESNTIAVYLCGAIAREGVYYLNDGSRVIDALELAGGLLEKASSKYVNLARILVDGEIIYFPTLEEDIIFLQKEEDEASDLVNINTADKSDLMELPGIGEAKALAIIDYRTKNEGFKSIEEIKKVSGIKEALFSTIKTLICV